MENRPYNKKYEAALTARQERLRQMQAPAQDSENTQAPQTVGKYEAALNARAKRIQTTIADIPKKLNQQIAAYNKSIRTPAFGTYEATKNAQKKARETLSGLRYSVENLHGDMPVSMVAKTLSTLDRLEKGYDSYLALSRFQTEDDYNKVLIGWLDPEAEVNEELASKRQSRYQSNEDRIAEIKNKLPWYGDTFLPAFMENWLLSDEDEALKKEMDTLEAENRTYKRLQGVLDQYYQPVTDEFLRNGAYRAYKNPTKEELRTFDANKSNAEQKIYSFDGENYRDQAGEIVQYGDDPGIEDKLGLFLSASDEEITEAYNALSAAGGNTTNTWANLMQEGDVNGWKHLKENELNIYYDLYKREGKEAAYRYLDAMTTTLTRRATQETTDAINNASTLAQIGLNIASIPMNVFGGVASFVDDAANILQGKDINPYSRAHSLQNAAGDIRSKTAEDINNATGNAALPLIGTTFGDVYQSLMSAADSAVGMAVGSNAYGVLMGTGAASSEMRALYEQGASLEQIAVGGILAGAAEMVFERYSIDKLVNMGDSKSIKAVIVNLLKQGGVEASEEIFTEIANTITNVVVMGNQSDWVDMKTFAKNVANAGIGGFISGGAMGGIGATAGYVNYGNQAKEYGEDLIERGSVDTIQQLAANMSAEKGALNAKRIGNLSEKVTSNATAKNVGKLADLMVDTVSSQNVSDIEIALEEKGLSKKEAMRVAQYLDKASRGGYFTEKEAEEVESDTGIREVYQSLIADPKSSVSMRTQELSSAISGEEYSRLVEAAQLQQDATQKTKVVTKTPEEAQTVQEASAQAPGATIRENRTVEAQPETVAANDRQVTGKESLLVSGEPLVTEEAKAKTDSLEEASRKYGPQAGAMIHTYHAGQDIVKYDQAYQRAYDMGKSGVAFDYVQKSAEVSYLTDNQKQLAYQAGRDAAERVTTLNETGETVQVRAVASFENGRMAFILEDGSVAAADQLTLSDDKALLRNAISEMAVSTQEADRLWQGYDGSISAEAYSTGITEAYQYGLLGAAYREIDSHAYAAALPERIRSAAYRFGKRALETERADRYNDTTNTNGGTENGTEAVHLRGGVQRIDGKSSGGSVRGMVEGTGALQSGQKEASGRSGGRGENHGTAQGQVSAKDLGLADGTEDRVLRYAPEDTPGLAQARALAAKNGLELVAFVGGNLTVRDENGIFEARAFIDGNRMCIRADHPEFSLTQQLRHELAHRHFSRDRVDMKKVLRAIRTFATEAYVEYVIASYVAEYSSLKGYGEDYILEEILCDYEAGMNIFSGEKVPVSFWQMAEQLLGSSDMKLDDERGPPADGAVHFSRETERFLRNFTGEVREGAYIYLSDVEKATIKSNIKTRFSQISSDAKRGIISAHDRSKGYTYHFICNADYSVTVIDVLDDVEDSAIIDRLQKEVTGNDRTGVRHPGKPAGTEGHGPYNRSNDGGTYEKTQPGKSSAEVDGETSGSDRQRDSGSGRANRANGGADKTRDPSKIKFSREFVQAQKSEQERTLEQTNRALIKDNTKLQEDNQYLKELLKLQREVTGGTRFTKTSVEAMARQLKTKANAKGDTKELAALLNRFYEGVASDRELTWEDVAEQAKPAADWLLENKRKDFVRDETAQQILNELHGRSFYLDEAQKAEAAYIYGSYQAFRQKVFGTVTPSDKAITSLDQLWKELANEHPYFFPADTVSTDQVHGIADAIETLRGMEATDREIQLGNTGEMERRALLHDVYDSFWRVTTLRTVADSKQKEINQLKAWHYAKMEQVKQAHKEATEQLKEAYRSRMDALREDYRKRTDEKLRKVKDANWDARRNESARRKESAAVKKNRAVVEKAARSLMDMLAHPTKDAHVPYALQAPLQKLLASIDFSSQTQLAGKGMTIRDVAYTRALAAVRTELAGQRSAMDGVEDGTFALDIPASFLDEIDAHIRGINDATEGLDLTTNRVYEMNSAELEDLGHLLKYIDHAIRNIDKLHMAGAKARVSELARSTMQEMERRTPVKRESGGEMLWANYTPWYAFQRMGTAAQQIFEGLTQGQSKLARTVDAALRFVEQTYTENEVKAWEKQTHTIPLDSGESVTMTTAQVMGFYCLSQRKHAYGHFMGGGIRVATIKEHGRELVQRTHYKLTAQDVSRINSLLTDRPKAVAEALQGYMQAVGGKLINEISMARWDYMAATEDHYYPIRTDEATRDAKNPGQDKTNLWALLNKSFTKGLTPDAKNAVVVESIFDVFADHMSETAEYNAFALPLVDAMRWFNYRERILPGSTSGEKQALSREATAAPASAASTASHIEDIGVQRSIRDTLGTAAVKYFVDLMTDINSSQKAGRHENWAGQMLSRSKVASVGWNLRVAVQQPTAILRASLILDMPSLVAGSLRVGTRELVEEMQQYSGIALWKAMGYYDLNVSKSVQEKIKHSDSLIDKANALGMWLPGKLDESTWARIWAAAKTQVSREQKLTGEALLKATAKLFDEIVYRTQVVDSVLTRSSLMRSKSQFVKEATAFMAEPTVSLNILMSAFQDYREGHTKWNKVTRGLMIGFYGYALSSIVNALVTSLMDAWRDEDEYEDFYEKFLQALFGGKRFWAGNLFSELNPLEKMVFVRDAVSITKGHSVSSGYAELVQSAVDLANNFKLFAEGRGTITAYGLLYHTLQMLGNVVGFGASGIAREVVSVWNNTFGKLYPDMLIRRFEIDKKTSIRNAFKNGTLTAEEAKEQLLQQNLVDTGDEAYWTIQEWEAGEGYSKYDAIYEAVRNGGDFNAALSELTTHGYTEKNVLSNVKRKIGEWYKDGEITKQQTIDMLTKYMDMDSGAITDTVNQWSSKVVTGIAFEDIKEEYLAGSLTTQRAIEMYVRYGGYPRDKATDTVKKWRAEKETGIAYEDIGDAFMAGELSRGDAKNMYITYGGLTEEKANEEVAVLAFVKKYPDLDDITYAAVEDYQTYCADAGVPAETFYDAWKYEANADADVDANGKSISGSRKGKVLDYIDGLALTIKQKDSLYYAFGWAESKIREAPWH